jgi:hypothetical protein
VPLILINGTPGLSPKGTFWLFAAVTLLRLGFVWFFLPETAGKSLEGMALGENEKGVDIEGAETVEDVNLVAKRN